MKKISLTPMSASLCVGLCISLVVALSMPGVAHADPGRLYAAPAAQGSGDCSTWGNACTLQTALAAAVSGDEIWVKAGAHYPGADRADTFILKNGVAVYGGFAGTEASREQRDWQTHVTILSGDIDGNDTNTDGNFIAETPADIQGANAYHVVAGGFTNNTAVLDGFVITAGQANGTAPHDAGGGMYNQDASPRLTNLIFSGNAADGGGGMYNMNSHPLLTDVTFSGNAAIDGGGMQNDHYSIPNLIRVTFDENTATRNGGGMSIGGDHADPVLHGVVFSNNTAGVNGGGVYVGGYNSSGGTYTKVVFSGNTAVEGGGMYNNNISPILTNVIFSGNAAQYGGGMANYRSTVELINATFNGNTASSQGGAMYSWWDRGPRLKNAILWGNSAPEGPEIYGIHGGDAIVSYSDIRSCGSSGAGWNSACGTDNGGNIDADPIFADAANDNLRLQLTSPAIDAGNNAFVPLGVTADLDGSPRFADFPGVPDTGSGTPPIVDMGAYEVDTTSPTVISSARVNANPTNSASVDFTVTFSEAVTGVAVGDFGLTTTGGVSGASVSSVSGGPTAYAVTVSTGAGSGTLRLDIPATATISDPTANDLSGLPYTGGEAYALDKTPPTVVSSTRVNANPINSASVDFTVTFSEAVTGVAVGDFSLTATGGVSGASVSSVSGGPTAYAVTVATGAGSGTLRLDLPATVTISDPAGNALNGLPYTGGEAYTIDKTAPTVVSITRADPNPTDAASVDFAVTFSEAVTGVDTGDFSLTTAGRVSGASVTVVNGNDVTYDVTISAGAGAAPCAWTFRTLLRSPTWSATR